MGTDQIDDDGSSTRQGIQSVELAMGIIQALEDGRGPMSLTQLATASGMTASKAHRYLVSLGRIGMVARSAATGLYDLGPALRRLGAEALRRMDEVSLVSEHLPGLRDRTSHGVNLAAWSDHGPVIVRWDYGAHALPITVRVGATMPLLTSSIGRVFLTHLPEAVTRPVLRSELRNAETPAPTAHEIASIKADVRRTGIASTSGGLIPGVASVAAPVFAATESFPLAVAIVLPAAVATPRTLDSISRALLDLTARVSCELGHSSPSTTVSAPER